MAAPEVDIGRGEVAQALVVAVVIVVRDEGLDPGLEFAGQIVVLQQDAVLQRLMPVRPEYSCSPWKIIMMESLNDWKFDDLAQFG